MPGRSIVVCCLISLTAVFCLACADPPSKEVNQAQGAIDAARAAGADAYAPEDIAGAIDSLQRAEAAVTQGDYRLALNLALESRERAQTAARQAAEARAIARGDAERIVAETGAMLGRGRDRLTERGAARLPRTTLQPLQDAVTLADTRMQEARTALAAGEYRLASERLEGLRARLHQAVTDLDAAAAAPPVRRKR